MAKARYHHGELRSALLDAAETLVRERGIDGWSLREASARVGVSPSAAYHHFDSRDALVRALSDRVLARLGERIARDTERVPDGQRLVALGQSYVHWALEDPAITRLAFSHTDREKPVSPHPHDVLVVELDRLGLKSRPGAEFVVWAAIHGLAVLLADGLVRMESHEDIDLEVQRVVRAVVTGLTHETAHPWPAAHSAHTDRIFGRSR